LLLSLREDDVVEKEERCRVPFEDKALLALLP